MNTEIGKLSVTEEGELKWFDIEEINTMKNQIIPSDFYMITELLLKNKEIKAVEIEMIQKEGELRLTNVQEY